MGQDAPLLRRATLLAASLLLAAGAARAQVVTVDSASANPNGTYTVWIEGTRYVALGEPALRRTAARADSLRSLIGVVSEMETIVRAREGEIAALDRQVRSGEALIAGQRAQIATFEALVRELRRAQGRGLGIELGAGLSRDDGAAGLAAVTWDRWGLWGLAGTERGVMAGIKYRLLQF
ncbi:MAG: hypothetical protein KY466_13395 [Gemmatimonadetes bacterium]|nr:hypothetical protein [Gemmatimonadota bacterium]